MAYLTVGDRSFFRDSGYLIKRDALTPDQVNRAQDALWEGIDADVEESGHPQAVVEARQTVEELLSGLSSGEGGPG